MGAGQAGKGAPPRGRWPTPGPESFSSTQAENGQAQTASPQGPTLLPEWVTAVLDGEDAPKLSPMRLVPGELVPNTRYRITRWLGDGGMGVVYEATHEDVDRRVAVKILRPEVCEKPEAVERFRNEARTANRVGSEHIADVYDFAELPDGRLLFAMELLEGETLAARVAHGPLEPGEVIGILRQLCKGLQDAHSVEIVHRDIKPDNIILVTRRGRRGYVKIMDLGIATLLVDGRAVASRMAGTPHYVAPEIVSGQSFDHRVDVYALGCTAYEMLTGQPPFDGENIPAILMAHLEKEPRPLSELRGDGHIPAALEQIVLECLAKHPQDRFADMNELEAALCEAQIEAGLHTAWDDLPVPDVGDERKERIIRGMPDPRVLDRPAPTRWLWPTLSVAAILIVSAVGWYWSPSRVLTDFEKEEVEEIADRAQAAAAMSLFVYPPADEPGKPTAIAHVLSLEHIEGPAAPFAVERAAQLRSDFASTLNRLGDTYAGKPGGEDFATEYYSQALVFDPDNEHALSRTTLTEGSIEALKQKAANQDFTQADLVRAEPLAVLAEDDPVERQLKLEELMEKEEERQRSLEKLAGTPSPPAKKKRPEAEATAPPVPAPTPPEKSVERDPNEAKRLARTARQAMTTGQSEQARKLFEQALEHDPRHAPALIGLADLEFATGAFQRAADHASRAVDIAPRRPEYRIRLGRALEKLGRADEAAAEYERADQLQP